MTNGVIFPMFAIIFGEIVEVFNLPIDQVFDEIHLWGGLFLLLGFVSGTAQFAKVRNTLYTHTHIYRYATLCVAALANSIL